MSRSQTEIAADIVLAQVNDGLVPVDLYQEGTIAGINVDTLIEQAEDLYELSETTFEESLDLD